MKLSVEVDQETINESAHMMCCACPVAKSVNRDENWPKEPRIVASSIHLRDGHCTVETSKEGRVEKMIHKFELPAIAVDFVAKWDARQSVEPISFELDLVSIRPAVNPRCTL